MERSLLAASASFFNISRRLHQEVQTRIAPFWFEQWVVNAEAVGADSFPHYPLTDVTRIAPNTEHPGRVANVDVVGNSLPALWFGAVVGRLSASSKRAFAEAGVEEDVFSFQDENIRDLVELTITGSVRGARAARQGATASSDLAGVTPYNLTMLQLGLYRSTKYQWWREPMIAVAGNTLEDFCLYYCLSRLRDRVVWVLPSLTEKALRDCELQPSSTDLKFVFQLRNTVEATQSEGGLACTTYSLSPHQLDLLIQRLRPYMPSWRQTTQIATLEGLLEFPLWAAERDNSQRDIALQFSDNRSISPFATPKPKHFHPVDPREHRYITQLSVVGDAPPQHFQLGTATVEDPRLLTSEARVGREGPAYFCPNVAYFGGDVDTVLVRPRLHVPPLSRIVEHLAQNQGYECRPSDKGIYADESIAKWGGLEEIGKFLRNIKCRVLLDRFLYAGKSEPGNGVYLKDNRRYLEFSAIENIAGDEAASVIDRLISNQILYRGFVFGCSFCRSVDCFSISEVTQHFTCRRCGRNQLYKKANWRMPQEPIWFYKLDEIVYQGYRHGMAVSLLALKYLKSESRESFTFATDREFWKPGASKPDVEADFLCALDGVLTAGEAKTESSLGKSTSEENSRIGKYLHLARALSIRQLVFATYSPRWGPETVERVKAAFIDSRDVRVRFLDGSHLL